MALKTNAFHLHKSGDDENAGDDLSDGRSGDATSGFGPTLTDADVAMQRQQRRQPNRRRVEENRQRLIEEQSKMAPPVGKVIPVTAQRVQVNEQRQRKQSCDWMMYMWRVIDGRGKEGWIGGSI